MVEKGKNDYSKKENEISKRDLINRSFIIVFPFFFLVPGWVAASLLISVKPTSTKQRWEKCNVLISRHERKLCAHHFVGFPLFDNLVTISNMQAFSWDIWIFSNKFTGWNKENVTKKHFSCGSTDSTHLYRRRASIRQMTFEVRYPASLLSLMLSPIDHDGAT